MKIRWAALGRSAMKEESGQIFVITGLGAMLLVGLAGLAIEVGHGYFALELLQASTNEATLAAAGALPDAATALANAQKYSSMASQDNAIGLLQGANLTVTPYCSTSVKNVYNIACQSEAPGDPPYNAVRVTQTATTGLWFGMLPGVSHTPLFNLTAIGAAANAGACVMCNIALVVDTTGTMGLTDKSGDCGSSSITAEACAMLGFQSLLGIAEPCLQGQTCGSGATPNDPVALFVFPSIDGTTGSLESNCSGSGIATVPYTVPTHPASTWSSSGVLNGGYGSEVLNFTAGASYRAHDSDPPTQLRSGDLMAQASGFNGCNPLQAPGGRGTYIAQAIYEAGEALQQEQAARPGSSNVLIVLSDGNMDAVGEYTWSGSNCTGTVTGLAVTAPPPKSPCLTNGTPGPSELLPANGIVTPAASGAYKTHSQINGTKVPGWSTQANISTYPSFVGQCGQSVQAASDVATQSSVNYTTLDGTSTTYTLNDSTLPVSYWTKVYTIAYLALNTSQGAGSQTTGVPPTQAASTQACFSDIPFNASTNWWTACNTAPCTQTVTTGGGSWPNPGASEGSITAYSPCAAMAAMASNANYFFSDNGAGCLATSTPNQGITSMQGIFTAIIDSLQSPKLIPYGTT